MATDRDRAQDMVVAVSEVVGASGARDSDVAAINPSPYIATRILINDRDDQRGGLSYFSHHR